MGFFQGDPGLIPSILKGWRAFFEILIASRLHDAEVLGTPAREGLACSGWLTFAWLDVPDALIGACGMSKAGLPNFIGVVEIVKQKPMIPREVVMSPISIDMYFSPQSGHNYVGAFTRQEIVSDIEIHKHKVGMILKTMPREDRQILIRLKS